MAQGSNEFIQNRFRKTLLLESLALIFGDLPPTSASAHMNYLIKLLKSDFAVFDWRTVELACRSEKGVFYAFPGGCQPLCLAGEASDKKCANLLTNQGFYTLYTAGNAWRPRQRMRTLRPHYQDSK
ncbi:hypothetical protein [Halomonas sp. HAL1]|uniref:hypothetical protein n=2 Tax=Halomonas sp. HAL1 TaxID=550984 RepID=UPI0026DFC1BF|nr:hypothetical protein [Halomonas sp. HAL1]WKV91649.1 hypothetical protein Q3Y66_12255 [Halomonas sp. HAL1]